MRVNWHFKVRLLLVPYIILLVAFALNYSQLLHWALFITQVGPAEDRRNQYTSEVLCAVMDCWCTLLTHAMALFTGYNNLIWVREYLFVRGSLQAAVTLMDGVHLGTVLITLLQLRVDGSYLMSIQQGFRRSAAQNQRTSHQSIQMRHVIVPEGQWANSCMPDGVFRLLSK